MAVLPLELGTWTQGGVTLGDPGKFGIMIQAG
jgi:hypothetical protein